MVEESPDEKLQRWNRLSELDATDGISHASSAYLKAVGDEDWPADLPNALHHAKNAMEAYERAMYWAKDMVREIEKRIASQTIIKTETQVKGDEK